MGPEVSLVSKEKTKSHKVKTNKENVRGSGTSHKALTYIHYNTAPLYEAAHKGLIRNVYICALIL